MCGSVFLLVVLQVSRFGNSLFSRSTGGCPNSFLLFESYYWHFRGGLIFLLGSSIALLHTPLVYTLVLFWSNTFLGRTEVWSQSPFMMILLHRLRVLDTKLRHGASRLGTETGTHWQMSWWSSSVRGCGREGGCGAASSAAKRCSLVLVSIVDPWNLELYVHLLQCPNHWSSWGTGWKGPYL